MEQTERYYVPHGSNWPIIGAVALFILMLGVSTALNGAGFGPVVAWTGAAILIVMLAILLILLFRDDGTETTAGEDTTTSITQTTVETTATAEPDEIRIRMSWMAASTKRRLGPFSSGVTWINPTRREIS